MICIFTEKSWRCLSHWSQNASWLQWCQAFTSDSQQITRRSAVWSFTFSKSSCITNSSNAREQLCCQRHFCCLLVTMFKAYKKHNRDSTHCFWHEYFCVNVLPSRAMLLLGPSLQDWKDTVGLVMPFASETLWYMSVKNCLCPVVTGWEMWLPLQVW